jgi:hypothetical protein
VAGLPGPRREPLARRGLPETLVPSCSTRRSSRVSAFRISRISAAGELVPNALTI